MSTTNLTKLETTECPESTCNGYGTCTVSYPGELIQSFECICDLWHTGQRCELSVPLPYVTSALAAVFTLGLLFFWEWSAFRFNKRKIHVAGERIRFVDFLHDTRAFERNLLLEEHASLIAERHLESLFTQPKKPDNNLAINPNSNLTSADIKKLETEILSTRQDTSGMVDTTGTGTSGVADTGVTTSGVDQSEKFNRSLAKVPSDQLVPVDASDEMLKEAKRKRDGARVFHKAVEMREQKILVEFEKEKQKRKKEKSKKSLKKK